jgi:hypothetical protein
MLKSTLAGQSVLISDSEQHCLLLLKALLEALLVFVSLTLSNALQSLHPPLQE